jgi:transcriptional regulator with XRE-family HTH domain
VRRVRSRCFIGVADPPTLHRATRRRTAWSDAAPTSGEHSHTRAAGDRFLGNALIYNFRKVREVAVKKATSEIDSSTKIVGDERRAEFGEFLASARRRAGRSLEEIGRTTKLSRRNLEALEQGRVEVLPPGMYRRAILRSYAESVALDPHVAIERFDRIFRDGAAARSDGGGQSESVPQGAPGTRSRIAPLRPVLLSAMASVPANSPPSIRTASLRSPYPLQPRHLAAAATLIVAAVGGLYFLTLPSSDARRPELASPQRSVKPTPEAATPSSAASDVAPSTGTSGRAVAASVNSIATSPAAVTTADQELLVTSTPAGARVTVNGIGWGITPLTIRHLPPGEKIVRVTKDGYAAGERRVQIGSAAGTAAVRLTLRPREPSPE